MEDAVSTTIGTGDFKNGSTATTEYTFDTNGNVTADKNKGIDSVKYNDLGKVVRVKFSDGHFLTYKYDAAGTKLTMKNYSTSGTLTTTTDYMGGFMYVNSALSFFSSPEGRVVKNGTNFEYQYSISDHQGNTRVLFTSATPSATTITATFEGDANDNSSLFTNVANIVSFTAANHTAGGSKVTRLNQAYPVGPAKSLKVYPGDKIDMNVWTYYENNTGFGTNSTGLTPMITAIAGAFGGVSGASGESGNIFNGVNSALGGFGLGGNAGDAAPAAYINYILYDKNYKVLNMGWTRVPSGAHFSKQQISIPQVSVTEAGYIFIYLSYEDQSNNYVEFDDFQVTYTPGPVIQANEYYPFGLQTPNSWTRDNATINNFLGNGGTELNTTTALYDLAYRNYDPQLARMNQVDPMANKYSLVNPYNYAFNNPVSFNDVNGADPMNPNYVSILSHWSQDFEESYQGADYGLARMAAMIRYHMSISGVESVGGWGEVYVGDIYGDSYGNMMGGEEAIAIQRARSGDIDYLTQYVRDHGQMATWDVEITNWYQNVHDPKKFLGSTATLKINISGSTNDKGNGWLQGAASAIIGFITTDLAIPEPSDLAWPKWVGYALAGGTAAAILHYAGKGNENYPGPLSYTIPDPTKHLLPEFDPEDNHFPNNNPNASPFAKIAVWTTATMVMLNELGVDVGKNISNGLGAAKSFWNDVQDKTARGIDDLVNWHP